MQPPYCVALPLTNANPVIVTSALLFNTNIPPLLLVNDRSEVSVYTPPLPAMVSAVSPLSVSTAVQVMSDTTLI